MTKQTTSTFLKRWQRRADVLQAVLDGLKGQTFSWGDGERIAYTGYLADFGIHLVTATWLEQRGYVLNRGAKPVGSLYFGSPISRSCAVYVLECQCYLKEPGKLAKVKAAAKERRLTKDSR